MRSIRNNIRTAQFGSLFSEGIVADASPSFEEKVRRRSEMFRQNIVMGVARCLTDIFHLFKPARMHNLPAIIRAFSCSRPPAYNGGADAWSNQSGGFPIYAAGDLRPETVLDAYGRGSHLVWICGNPVWEEPARRSGGDPAEAKEPRRALALLREGARSSLDRDFDGVATQAAREGIHWCRPFQPGPCGLSALSALHDAGFGHSVEIRNSNGDLIGGCYGLATGRIFITQARFGEGAAADLAIVMLNRHLAHWGFALHLFHPTLAGQPFGFQQQDRNDLAEQLTGHLCGDKRGRWLAVPSLCSAA